jgi:hypothetical protein
MLVYVCAYGVIACAAEIGKSFSFGVCMRAVIVV